MKRLLVHVEGQTEETFVREVLAPHLVEFGYVNVSARLVGNVRQRSHRGGARAWEAVRGDIVRHLREDRASLATTMVDFYGMPATGGGAWPGRESGGMAAAVEIALQADVAAAMGGDFNPRRFIPFVVMHEFEGLLFSDCAAFSRGIERPDLEPNLQAIRDAFGSPEEINDSQETAPSKRVAELMPSYQKPVLGVRAALAIGLDRMRAECPHFRTWLERLES